MVRAMEVSDIPRVAEIHVFGWRCAYGGIISDEFLFTKMLVASRITRFESYIRDNIGESYVFDDGIIKAFMTIGACRDEDKTEAFELWGIYVEPLMKRQGIGSTMVDYCEKIAIERGYKEICLWVLAKNESARRFYEKSGFFTDGASKFIEALRVTEIRYSKIL